MKKSAVFIATAGILLVCSGCSPILWTASEEKYRAGEMRWYLTDADALNRNIVGRMAIDKLKHQPIPTGTSSSTSDDNVSKGYVGVVANLDRYHPVNILVEGPECKSFYLEPGQHIQDRLLPGTYIASAYRGGMIDGRWIFHSEIQEKYFAGRKVSWYVVYNSVH